MLLNHFNTVARIMLYIMYVVLATSVLILTQQKLAQYKSVDSKLGLGIPNLIIPTS